MHNEWASFWGAQIMFSSLFSDGRESEEFGTRDQWKQSKPGKKKWRRYRTTKDSSKRARKTDQNSISTKQTSWTWNGNTAAETVAGESSFARSWNDEHTKQQQHQVSVNFRTTDEKYMAQSFLSLTSFRRHISLFKHIHSLY